MAGEDFILHITIFALAVLIGRLAVRRPARALRLPLIAVAAAVSCVSIVGALVATGSKTSGIAAGFGFLALVLTCLGAVAGILLARRLLAPDHTGKR